MNEDEDGVKCSKCGNKIEYLCTEQEGIQSYDFYVDALGESKYDKDTFYPYCSELNTEFTCPCCDAVLAKSECEARKILAGEE